MTFDGVSGKRIYGPVVVAKAAQIYGSVRMGTNADSYAIFANGKRSKHRAEDSPLIS